MFNVTVLKLRDIIKFLIEAALAIIIIFLFSKFFQKNLSHGMEQTLHVMSSVEEKNQTTEKNDYLESFLKTELTSAKYLNENEIIENDENDENDENETNENNESNDEPKTTSVSQTEIPSELKTEIVTKNPIKLTYNVEYENVKIKNETSYDLNNDILNPNIEIENKNIVLFHTHTCESYTSSEKYPYTPTGTFRTTDQNFSVVRVGNELENYLKQFGFNVNHDKTYHDYPAYNGSYTRSLQTVSNILDNTPSDIVFDIHRDAIGSRSDYAPTVKIGEEDYAAQIMFVIGTNEGGLWHPNWNQNLKFAVKVQQKAEEMYPRFI